MFVSISEHTVSARMVYLPEVFPLIYRVISNSARVGLLQINGLSVDCSVINKAINSVDNWYALW